MNLQPELDYCPQCEAKLEYDAGELDCPNCGWQADPVYVEQYEASHGHNHPRMDGY
jgi:hypothetical protein